MMSLDFIRGLQTLIIAFLSYVITITFAGWFESLIAKKVGDDTPEEEGFLTLNPLDHFNVFGFAAVLWGIFYGYKLPIQLIPGWGRRIPLSPDLIQGRNSHGRVFMLFTGRSCGHLVLLLTFATCMIAYSVFVLDTLQPLMMAVHTTSFVASIMNLFTFIYYQNLILFSIHFVVGLFQYVSHFYGSKFYNVSTVERFVFGFIILIAALFILVPLLEAFVYLVTAVIQLIILKIRLLV